MNVKVRFYNRFKEHTSTMEPTVTGTETLHDELNHYRSLAFSDEYYFRIFINGKHQSGFIRVHC